MCNKAVYVYKYYSWPWPPCLIIFENQKVVWINEDLALCKAGLKYFKKYFLNIKNYKLHWGKWEEWGIEYEKKEKELKKTNLKLLNDRELARALKDFYDFNIKFWLIVHVPEIANWGGEYFLNNKLKKLYKDKAGEYMEILSAPIKYSFFQKEELDLLALAKIKNKPEFNIALKNHANKYYWLLNSYGGNRILNEEYFLSQIKKYKKNLDKQINEIKKNIHDNLIKKKKLIRKLKLNNDIALIADQLSQSIWWQDLRKSYIWRIQFFWDKFLREIVRRSGWKFNELQWCFTHELLAILNKKNKFKKKEINKRKKYFIIYSEKNKLETITDKKIIKKAINDYLNVETDGVREIKGQVVSRGKGASKIKGRVKIIKNPFKDGRKMKKGDILVAGMTSPEFIVVMRKARAVITDQGGMTAHAAIVSRELRIPCLVGTKIATQVLQDGDLVEVDADRGIVKKLK